MAYTINIPTSYYNLYTNAGKPIPYYLFWKYSVKPYTGGTDVAPSDYGYYQWDDAQAAATTGGIGDIGNDGSGSQRKRLKDAYGMFRGLSTQEGLDPETQQLASADAQSALSDYFQTRRDLRDQGAQKIQDAGGFYDPNAYYTQDESGVATLNSGMLPTGSSNVPADQIPQITAEEALAKGKAQYEATLADYNAQMAPRKAEMDSAREAKRAAEAIQFTPKPGTWAGATLKNGTDQFGNAVWTGPNGTFFAGTATPWSYDVARTEAYLPMPEMQISEVGGGMMGEGYTPQYVDQFGRRVVDTSNEASIGPQWQLDPNPNKAVDYDVNSMPYTHQAKATRLSSILPDDYYVGEDEDYSMIVPDDADPYVAMGYRQVDQNPNKFQPHYFSSNKRDYVAQPTFDGDKNSIWGPDKITRDVTMQLAEKLGISYRDMIAAAETAADKARTTMFSSKGHGTSEGYHIGSNPAQIIQGIANEMFAKAGREPVQLFTPEQIAKAEASALARRDAARKARTSDMGLLKKFVSSPVVGMFASMLLGPQMQALFGGGMGGAAASKALLGGIQSWAGGGDPLKGALTGGLTSLGGSLLKGGFDGMLGGAGDDLVSEIGGSLDNMNVDEFNFSGFDDPIEALIAGSEQGLVGNDLLKFVEDALPGSTDLGGKDAIGKLIEGSEKGLTGDELLEYVEAELPGSTNLGSEPGMLDDKGGAAGAEDDLMNETDDILDAESGGFKVDAQTVMQIAKLAKMVYGITQMGDSGGSTKGMPQPKQAPPTPPAPDAPPEEQAPYQEALVEYLGLDPETMANAGVEIGTQEYLDYILEQANAIIEQIFGADPSALLEGDSIEGLQAALKNKTEEEMERLLRALHVRGQRDSFGAYEGEVYDPFTNQKYESGMIGGIKDPDIAGYMRGLAGQVDVLGGMRGDQARAVLGGLLERNPDIYGLQRAMDVRKMQEMLAAAIEDEKKRKQYSDSKGGKHWQDLFEEQAKNPAAIQKLLDEVTGGDTARQGRLVEALFGWDQN